MTKKNFTITILCALAITMIGLPAKAEDGRAYFSIGGLIGKEAIKTNLSSGNVGGSGSKKAQPVGGEIAFGGYLTEETRTELAVTYLDTKGKTVSFSGFPTDTSAKTKVRTLEGLLNFYYDFKNTSPAIPYVVGGIGITHHKVSATVDKTTTSNSNSKRKTMPAFQLGIGVDFCLADKVKFGVGYRLKGLATRPITIDKLDDRLKVKIKPAHLLLANLKFEF